MVGWSRRSAEDSARRRRWWASLSDDEREMHAFLSEVNGPRDMFLIFKTIVFMFIGMTVMFFALSK